MVNNQSASGVEDLLRAAEILDNWDREREHGYAAMAPQNTASEVSESFSGGDSPLGSTSSVLNRVHGNQGTGSNRAIVAINHRSHGRRRRHSASGSSSGRHQSTSSSSPDVKVKGSGKETVHNGFVRSAHNELEKSRRASMRSCLEALRMLLPNEHLERTSTGKNTTLSVLRSARSFIKALHDCMDQKTDTRTQLMSEQTKKLHRLSVLTSMTSGNNGTGAVSANAGLETLGNAAVALAAVQNVSSKNNETIGAPVSSDTVSPLGDASKPVDSFDNSPPVSVVRPALLSHPMSRTSKIRSISENSSISLIPVTKDGKEEDDFASTRVVYVTPSEGNQHATSNTPGISSCSLTALKSP